jgi:hypothetical protein
MQAVEVCDQSVTNFDAEAGVLICRVPAASVRSGEAIESEKGHTSAHHDLTRGLSHETMAIGAPSPRSVEIRFIDNCRL